MPIVPSYKRDLQCYGGIGRAASSTQTIADGTLVQFTTMNASYGATAYNCLLAADFDDITVYTSGIYEVVFEVDTHNGEEGSTLWDVRDDGTAIASATSHFGSTAAEFSMFKSVGVSGCFSITAGSVIDVAVTCSSACTLTTKNCRLWLRKIAPAA